MYKLMLGVGLAALLAAAVRAEDADKPEIGKPAPAFDLPAAGIELALPDSKDAKALSLKDLKGKNVVLFFYPKAMTKGCTVESCGFRDKVKGKEFEKLNTVVIGISTDRVAEQQKFIEKEGLNFPLLADADKKVTKAYGALNAKNGLAARYTFIIDDKGVLRKTYTAVKPDAHPKEVLEWVKENLAK